MKCREFSPRKFAFENCFVRGVNAKKFFLFFFFWKGGGGADLCMYVPVLTVFNEQKQQQQNLLNFVEPICADQLSAQ